MILAPQTTCDAIPTNDEAQEIKQFFDKGLVVQLDNSLDKSGLVKSVLLDGIDGLPEEIMSEIFLCCLPRNHYPVISWDEPPLLLTRVSRGWKRVALGTPRLWTSVHVPWPVLPDPDPLRANLPSNVHPFVCQRLLEAMGMWLDRSASLPLNISLVNFHHPNRAQSLLQNAIVLPSARLTTLTVCGTTEFLHSVASLRLEAVPVLESLSMKGLDITIDLDVTRFDSSLFIGPQLRTLEFEKISLDAVRLPVNWLKLTHLTLLCGRHVPSFASLTIRNITTILRLARNLISCKFEIYPSILGTDEPSTLFSSGIYLVNLERLSIQDHNVDLTQFFDVLHVPSLERIEFNSDATLMSPEISMASIKSLVERVGSQIKSFTSDLNNFSESDFAQILQFCPNISAISITPSASGSQDSDGALSMFYAAAGMTRARSIVNDDIFRVLISGTSEGTFLAPNLTDLRLLQAAHFSELALSGFLEQKQTMGGAMQKLRYLEVRFLTKQRSSLELKLGRFQQDGLDFKLWYPLVIPAAPLNHAAGVD